MRIRVWSLAPLSGLRIPQCCGELWCRLAAEAALQLLAWEFPYAAGVAQKKKEKKKEKGILKFETTWIMDESDGRYAKWNKPNRKMRILYDLIVDSHEDNKIQLKGQKIRFVVTRSRRWGEQKLDGWRWSKVVPVVAQWLTNLTRNHEVEDVVGSRVAVALV